MAATLDDDPQGLHEQIETCRARIQSITMCEKLTRFVYASRETKDTIRKHARTYPFGFVGSRGLIRNGTVDNNLDLVVTIVRGSDEPRLDKYDLERIIVSNLLSYVEVMSLSNGIQRASKLFKSVNLL